MGELYTKSNLLDEFKFTNGVLVGATEDFVSHELKILLLADGNMNVFMKLDDGLEINTVFKKVSSIPLEPMNIDPIDDSYLEKANDASPATVLDKEITFRGVPWGLSPEEVKAKLQDLNLHFYFTYKETARHISALILDEKDDSLTHDSIYRILDTYGGKTDIKQVAGYDIDTVVLFFAYAANDAGEIPQSSEGTKFFFAEYILSPDNMEMAYKNLKEKLISIYGQPGKEENVNVNREEHTLSYWYGANDTMAVLDFEDEPSDYSDCIHIYYAWNKGEEILEETEKILNDIGNVDGL